MIDAKLESLPKSDLLQRIENAYVEAKPANDRMVDISLNIQTLTAEVIRRAVIGWLPGIAIKETRVVATIACSRNINEALPKLKTRLDGFAKEGVKIVAVEFDHNLLEYRFYTTVQPQQKASQ